MFKTISKFTRIQTTKNGILPTYRYLAEVMRLVNNNEDKGKLSVKAISIFGRYLVWSKDVYVFKYLPNKRK